MALAKHLYDAGQSPLENGPALAFVAEGDKMVATHSALPGEDTALRRAQVLVLVSTAVLLPPSISHSLSRRRDARP